jgi:hypothetical protein
MLPGFTAKASLGSSHGHYCGRIWPPARSAAVESAAIHWGSFKRDHCTGTGKRQYSSILWSIPWGQSWERACAVTPGQPPGLASPRPPNRCANTGFSMWGEWDVPDTSCGTSPSDCGKTICRDDPASSDPRCQICTRNNCNGTASIWHTC